MKTTDLFKINRTSKRLNESMFKTFGRKLNLETFNVEQLEDARNKLRTQIYTARSSSSFNENVENDALSQAQFMHDAIVAELSERDEPIVDNTVQEGADIDKQTLMMILKNFDENMNERGGYGDPDYNKVLAALNQGDVESAVEEVYYAYSDQDGGEIDMDDYIEDLEDQFKDMVGGEVDEASKWRDPKYKDQLYTQEPPSGDEDDSEDVYYNRVKPDDYQGAKRRMGDDDYDKDPLTRGYGRSGMGSLNTHGKRKGLPNRDQIGSLKGSIKAARGTHNRPRLPENNIQTELSTNTLKSYQDKAGKDIVNTMTSGDYMTTDKSAKKVMNRMKGSEKADNKIYKKENESIEQTGDNMSNLREGEIQQASAIVTAKTMVDRVGRWIEELSGMENDTLLQLGDSIRDEMGQEQAKGFIEAVAPAIQSALENLKTTREALASGVRTLTGEEQPANMLGGDPAADMSAEPDAMNPEMGAEEPAGDEFAAAEPAAGGAEEAGREMRESINHQNRLMRALAG
jgi:hypothetical protein